MYCVCVCVCVCLLVQKKRAHHSISRESADPYTIEWNIIHILCDSIRADIVAMSINKYAMAVGQNFVRSLSTPTFIFFR